MVRSGTNRSAAFRVALPSAASGVTCVEPLTSPGTLWAEGAISASPPLRLFSFSSSGCNRDRLPALYRFGTVSRSHSRRHRGMLDGATGNATPAVDGKHHQ